MRQTPSNKSARINQAMRKLKSLKELDLLQRYRSTNITRKQRSKRLLREINQSLQNAPPDKEEGERLKQVHKHHERMVKGTW